MLHVALLESKLQLVSLIEFICSEPSFFAAHVNGVSAGIVI